MRYSRIKRYFVYHSSFQWGVLHKRAYLSEVSSEVVWLSRPVTIIFVINWPIRDLPHGDSGRFLIIKWCCSISWYVQKWKMRNSSPSVQLVHIHLFLWVMSQHSLERRVSNSTVILISLCVNCQRCVKVLNNRASYGGHIVLYTYLLHFVICCLALSIRRGLYWIVNE